MRNDFIGTSIDGDARAACGCRHHGANTINTAGCGCENNRHVRFDDCTNGCARQERGCGNACGCENDQRTRRNDCTNGCARQERGCSNTCGCENDQRTRHNDCTNDCTRQERGCGNACGCENDQHTRRNDCTNGCNGRSPAMVYAEHHDLDSVYCAEKALLRGTLFGCLDKPMCNERCTENVCTSPCQENKFSIWELRLYLNTHPCDKQALALLRRLIQQMDEDCGCASTYDCSRWSWIEGPWPWEYQRCCGKEA